jgi:hypothetical protein
MTRRKASGHSNQALLISGPSKFGRRQMRSGLPRLRTATFAIAVAFASWPALAQTGPGWTTSWGTSQQVLGQTRVSNATLRLIARVTVPGDAIRLRFDNTTAAPPLWHCNIFVPFATLAGHCCRWVGCARLQKMPANSASLAFWPVLAPRPKSQLCP